MSRSLLEIVKEHIDSGRARVPVLDRNAARAQAMLADGNFDLDELAQLIGSDPALTSALLRAANSAFFGGLEKVTTIRDAMMRLGSRRVSQLVVLLSQRESYHMHDAKLRTLAENLWRHSVACSIGAEWIAKRLSMPEVEREAMLGGLLHDVGKLFLLMVIDDLKRDPKARFETSDDFVLDLLRGLHCEQGERLLEAWSIPEVYRRVVRHHHDAELDESDLLLLVVRLVDHACNRLGIGLEPDPDLVVAATPEAELLRASEVLLAELEVQLEDALELAG